MDRTLTGALLNRAGILALALETGPRSHLDPPALHAGRSAVAGILARLDLVPPVQSPRPGRIPGSWRRENGPQARKAGLLLPGCQPGALLEPGALLAEVRGLTGEVLEKVRAPGHCFVVSFPDRAPVEVGRAVCALAVPDPTLS